MSTFTPILHIEEVAPNQDQKEGTINTATAILEAAMNDAQTLSLSGGARTVTQDEFTRNFYTIFAEQPSAVIVTFPATPRFFAVKNTGAFTLTLKALGSASTPLTLGAGKSGLIVSDGVTLGYFDGSAITRLADLSDVSGADAPSAGSILVYDSGTGFWDARDGDADIDFFVAGKPAAGALVFKKVFTRTTNFLNNFVDSAGAANLSATGVTTYAVRKGATVVGSIVFGAGQITATFTTASGAVTYAPGDVMTITAPNPQDATHSDPAVTLKGVLV